MYPTLCPQVHPSPVVGSANVFCEGLASMFGCAGHTASTAPQESNQTTQTKGSAMLQGHFLYTHRRRAPSLKGAGVARIHYSEMNSTKRVPLSTDWGGGGGVCCLSRRQHHPAPHTLAFRGSLQGTSQKSRAGFQEAQCPHFSFSLVGRSWPIRKAGARARFAAQSNPSICSEVSAGKVCGAPAETAPTCPRISCLKIRHEGTTRDGRRGSRSPSVPSRKHQPPPVKRQHI